MPRMFPSMVLTTFSDLRLLPLPPIEMFETSRLLPPLILPVAAAIL